MPQLQRLAVNPAQIYDRKIDLTPEQQHYLHRVLRLQAGDRFIAMDGRGHWWLAVLEAQETGLMASITEEIAVNRELGVEVTLMAALPKGNGFDEVVRQAAELGVASIVPVTSDRTLLKPSGQKVERWRRIAAEAAEQSERQFVPAVFEPISFDLAVKDCCQKYRYICVARGDYRHLWDCLIAGFDPPQPPLIRGEQDGATGFDSPQPPGRFHSPKNGDEVGVVPPCLPPHRRFYKGFRPPGGHGGTAPTKNETALPQPPLIRGEQDGATGFDPPQPPLIRGEEDGEELAIVIAVGPEGGWTEGEVKRAIEFGFEPVSLGSRILRAVTAPIVALSLVGAAFEKC